MKKVILCSLLLFLSGCGLFKSNEPTKIEVAQIDANNVVDSFFKEYKPIKESEIITTKYVIYVFSISDNSYNQNIDNMLLEKINYGLILMYGHTTKLQISVKEIMKILAII